MGMVECSVMVLALTGNSPGCNKVLITVCFSTCSLIATSIMPNIKLMEELKSKNTLDIINQAKTAHHYVLLMVCPYHLGTMDGDAQNVSLTIVAILSAIL